MAHRAMPKKGIARKQKDVLEEKRIVIVDPERCKPNMPAFKYLQRHAGGCGKFCIEIIGKEVNISEDACAACVNRASKCPDNAVTIVKLPTNLDQDTTHRYGRNAFKLHGIPMPRPGHVLGLLGTNGIGKSTALHILAGKLKPNLGRVGKDEQPTWQEILKYYRGSDLQNYLTRLLSEELSVVIKPQMDTFSAKAVTGRKVADVIKSKDERGVGAELCKRLDLNHLLDREMGALSGGELQRLAIACSAMRDANVFMFDESTSFLDVRQRLAATEVIRSLVTPEGWGGDATRASQTYVVVVEHDLAILDYMSDYICCLFGEPGAYGVVTQRMSVYNGINQYLSGYFSVENMRFRKEAIDFHISIEDTEMDTAMKVAGVTTEGSGAQQLAKTGIFNYPSMSKTLVDSRNEDQKTQFTLHVEQGAFTEGEILGLLGENGCGKTTFMQLLAGAFDEKPEAQAAKSKGKPSAKKVLAQIQRATDDEPQAETPPLKKEAASLADLGISWKRQHNAPRFRRFPGSVQQLLERTVNEALADRLFRLLVMRPLKVELLAELPVKSLSGGELQRLAIVICLGTPAQVYLIDEPSAGLDCEQRVIVSRVIKRWVVTHLRKTAFVIEHDFMMATAMSDRIIVYSGQPGVECTAHTPQGMIEGMNTFLKHLQVTFRRDPNSHRPRINKKGSNKDSEQRAAGAYFVVDAIDDEKTAKTEKTAKK
eukprot:SAG31_NODE_2568_length_5463_cov_3.107196_1_plen_710_part_00